VCKGGVGTRSVFILLMGSFLFADSVPLALTVDVAGGVRSERVRDDPSHGKNSHSPRWNTEVEARFAYGDVPRFVSFWFVCGCDGLLSGPYPADPIT
jgi:hypothetical protein